ncbi:MAG: hypothetical protein LBQ84_03880 [Flavobacteriaceae bacterium]|jgi:hypothetical protein|nr:hypothetical protein [Flavobacteriaceae bacterium]
MKLIRSVFLICLILFANLNLFVYQSWCHGESIGYAVNSKKFDSPLADNEIPSFNRDLCCKDVLIKSNENPVFSLERILQQPLFNSMAILPGVNENLPALSFNQKAKIPQLYSNPPPFRAKLYQFYCRYTYYG